MPRNVEVKAKVFNPDRLRQLAEELSNSPGTLLEQNDTFYCASNGRLKLRRSKGEEAPCRLYFYEREDLHGPKMSDYHFTTVAEPDALHVVLSRALGVLGIVIKQRRLYLVGQTRIHIDHVENLGHFMELEVVLNETQSEEEGSKIAEQLMTALEIKSEDLIDCAYMDLLLKK